MEFAVFCQQILRQVLNIRQSLLRFDSAPLMILWTTQKTTSVHVVGLLAMDVMLSHTWVARLNWSLLSSDKDRAFLFRGAHKAIYSALYGHYIPIYIVDKLYYM